MQLARLIHLESIALAAVLDEVYGTTTDLADKDSAPLAAIEQVVAQHLASLKQGRYDRVDWSLVDSSRDQLGLKGSARPKGRR